MIFTLIRSCPGATFALKSTVIGTATAEVSKTVGASTMDTLVGVGTHSIPVTLLPASREDQSVARPALLMWTCSVYVDVSIRGRSGGASSSTTLAVPTRSLSATCVKKKVGSCEKVRE
jgi:hypothetical protein